MKRYILFLCSVFLGACQTATVFERYEVIPEESWSRYHIVEFTAPIPDSGLYTVKLCLRHSTDYEMTNLWCFISTRSHATTQLSDTVDLKVTTSDGRWLGKGGSLKTLEQAINRNPVRLPKGNVLFRIGQGMETEKLKGVKNVGIKIEKMNEEG